MLAIVDPRTDGVVWRAIVTFEVVIDVRAHEQDRRTHEATAKQIVDVDGDFVLTLKANQETLHQSVARELCLVEPVYAVVVEAASGEDQPDDESPPLRLERRLLLQALTGLGR